MKTNLKLIALAVGLTGGIAYAACCGCGDKCTCGDKCACTAEKCACPAKPAPKAVDECAGACEATAKPAEAPPVAKPAEPAAPPAAAPAEQAEGYTHIGLAGVKAAVAEGKTVILDARAGKWDDGKRIPGAKQLAPGDAAAKAATMIPAKDSRVIVYCTNLHCPASKHLAEELVKLGYTGVEKYPEGIEGWIAAGNAVETAK